MTWASCMEASIRYAFPLRCSCHTTHIQVVFQTNILVDKDNNAWIAGLGNAAVLHRSTACTAEGGTSTTEAEDMHAFGVLAWEVRTQSFVRALSVCSLETDSHRTVPVLWNDGDCGNALDAERDSATETGRPPNLRSNMVYDRTLLAQRTFKAHVS